MVKQQQHYPHVSVLFYEESKQFKPSGIFTLILYKNFFQILITFYVLIYSARCWPARNILSVHNVLIFKKYNTLMFLQNKNTNFYSPKSIRTPLDTWFLFGESLTLKPDSVQKVVLIYIKNQCHIMSYFVIFSNSLQIPIANRSRLISPFS